MAGEGITYHTPSNANVGKGGGFDLESLMAMLKPTNPLVSAGLSAGGALAGGIGDLLTGPSEGEKKARDVYGMAKNKLGQSVLDPDQYLADYMRALAPQVNKKSAAIAKRTGMDSGVASGALWDVQSSTLSGLMAEMKKFNAVQTANQDMGLMRLMLGATGNMG